MSKSSLPGTLHLSRWWLRVLQERVEAVEEICESSSEQLHILRDILKGLPDLAKGLCRIQYGQASPFRQIFQTLKTSRLSSVPHRNLQFSYLLFIK